MKSLLLFKKFKSVLLIKKIDFDLSKYQICFVVFRKKWILEIKIQICLVMIIKKKKKTFLMIEKSDMFFYKF